MASTNLAICLIFCNHLHRAIQKYLEDPLAEEILNLNVKNGDILIAGLDKDNGKIIFEIKRSETQTLSA